MVVSSLRSFLVHYAYQNNTQARDMGAHTPCSMCHQCQRATVVVSGCGTSNPRGKGPEVLLPESVDV